METMETIVANFEAELDLVKLELESYIRDKSLPVSDRWDVWKKAPDCLKNQKCFYYDMYLDGGCLTDSLSDDYSRHETINTADFIDRIVEIKYFEYTENVPEDKCPNIDTWEPEGMDMLKEKILADNMGSFIYDW